MKSIKNRIPALGYDVFYSMVAVSLAALGRKYLLDALGGKIVYVTFYPAVMIVSMIRGWFAGIVSAVFSSLIILYAWWFFFPKPLIADHGDYIGMAAFLFNCTMIAFVAEIARRRRLEAQNMRDAAEKANKAKTIFLANMSHELRTPLNAILGFTRLMLNSNEVVPDYKRNLSIIHTSSEHLLNLINNLLDISRIETGHLSLENEKFDLYVMLNELSSMLNVAASQKGLVLKIDKSPEIPRYIISDSGKLRQILINLVGNAIKYTKNGTIAVRVNSELMDDRKICNLLFQIQDSGPGISPEDIKKLFTPFVQLNKSDAKVGTGLGLAICKQYVEVMGGSIGVNSQIGVGSIFHFSLPVIVAESSIDAKIEELKIIGIAEGEPEYKILIVEDIYENRVLLSNILQPLNQTIREAVNGIEAVRIAEEWGPDLIWMDIRMAEMDGVEAIKRIRALSNCKGTKIIALTAHAHEEERQEVISAGCDDFIRKPFKEFEIYNALAIHLGLRFRYEYNEVYTHNSGILITPAMLSNIPFELLDRLRTAALELNTFDSLAVIEQIKGTDEVLSNSLAGLAREFQFDRIISLIDLSKISAGT